MNLSREVWYAGAALPTVTATLRDEDGQAIAYAGTETVEFLARYEYGNNLFRSSAAFVSGEAALGRVRFDPSGATVPADAALGVVDLFWAITAGGKTEYIPAGQWEIQKASQTSGEDAHVDLEPYALTTLEAVKEEMSTAGQKSSLDNILRRRINQASSMVIAHAEQEFLPLIPDATPRLFPVRDGKVWFGGDLKASPTPVVTANPEGTPTVMGATTYQPIVTEWMNLGAGYKGLTLLNGNVYRDPSTGATGYVQVVGEWGWSVIPADVERLVIQTVVQWSRRDLFIRNENLEGDDPSAPVTPGVGLPPSVARYIEQHYKPIAGTRG